MRQSRRKHSLSLFTSIKKHEQGGKMELFEDKIKERIYKLKQIIKEKESALKKVPSGTVHIDKSGGKTQFYHYYKGNSRYMNQSENSLVQELFQKDYDEKVKKRAEKEKEALERLLKKYPMIQTELVFDTLHEERKKLVQPIWLSNEEFRKKWEEEEYEKKGFRKDMPEYYTNKGERVRSKSEIIIANALEKHGIPYRYEAPLNLPPYGIVYPDFTVLHMRMRKTIWWEHMGKMDDESYREYALERILLYEKNGYFPGQELILTHETLKNPLNSRLIDKIIEKYLK